MSGNLETKYKVKDLGLTVTEKWTTENDLNTTLDVQDKLMPGLKVKIFSESYDFNPPPLHYFGTPINFLLKSVLAVAVALGPLACPSPEKGLKIGKHQKFKYKSY